MEMKNRIYWGKWSWNYRGIQYQKDFDLIIFVWLFIGWLR